MILKTHLMTLTAILMFSVSFSASAVEETTTNPPTKNCEMKIDGMSCGSCAGKVKNAVKDDASSVEIDMSTGMAKMSFVEGKTTCDNLAKKVTDLGYKATVVK